MNATQLAERLEQGHTVFNGTAAAMLRKQADRIEHLEKQVLECGIGAGCCHQAIRIEQLERENAELQSKLEKAEHDLFHANNKLESMTKVKNFVEWGGL